MLRIFGPACLIAAWGACFGSAFALKALSKNLRCELHFLEAHLNVPPGHDKKKDARLTNPEMHKIFSRAPLSTYAYFRKIETQTWHLEMLKPVRHEFPFLARYELTYLEAHLNSLGQALYRFEHKVGHRRGAGFSLDTLEPAGIFLQHMRTHDQFLHLTCSPE